MTSQIPYKKTFFLFTPRADDLQWVDSYHQLGPGFDTQALGLSAGKMRTEPAYHPSDADVAVADDFAGLCLVSKRHEFPFQ